MPAPVRSTFSVPQTYSELRRSVEEVIFAGRAKIEEAWLRTYHDTGRLIHEHLLLHQDRADFGAKLFIRLADDTGISKRVLYECVQLYRCFPIVRTSAQLTRSHYMLLCQVPDQAKRESLLTQTIKHEWTVADLTPHVRSFNAAAALTDGTNGGNGANGATSAAGEAPHRQARQTRRASGRGTWRWASCRSRIQALSRPRTRLQTRGRTVCANRRRRRSSPGRRRRQSGSFHLFVQGESGEVFLNNHLLVQGHASRKDAWEFGDWGV